ncbi:MAG: hypothetical protein JRG86_16575 [Deltaproteobacteria bacterium]|jgi:hypothetical protein|nr:hypothetical protein [Deltaproteobacteria bacterium]MBW2499246.1 hypothetical protein [Deltaproteobacteria bacterium]
MPSLPNAPLCLLAILLASAGVTRAQIQEAQAEVIATAAGDTVEPFAVEVDFITQAQLFEGREVEAEADFLNTQNPALAIDTPGITIDAIPTAAAVPGFGAVGLALLVILVGVSTSLLARYRRLKDREHEAASPEPPEAL